MSKLSRPGDTGQFFYNLITLKTFEKGPFKKTALGYRMEWILYGAKLWSVVCETHSTLVLPSQQADLMAPFNIFSVRLDVPGSGLFTASLTLSGINKPLPSILPLSGTCPFFHWSRFLARFKTLLEERWSDIFQAYWIGLASCAYLALSCTISSLNTVVATFQ